MTQPLTMRRGFSNGASSRARRQEYEAYCGVVGLSIHQFNEPAIGAFHIHLTSGYCGGDLYIGGGNSRWLRSTGCAIKHKKLSLVVS